MVVDHSQDFFTSIEVLVQISWSKPELPENVIDVRQTNRLFSYYNVFKVKL